MLIHAYNNRRTIRRVVEEPFQRWRPYTVAAFRFPNLIQA